jgi:hypothetical protein
MSVQSVAKRFVELVNQGKNFDVMRTLYSPGIVSVEGDGSETAGQEAVIRKSEKWVEDKSFDYQAIRGPFFNGPNQFAVHYVHKVTPRATGKQVTLEEVGVYTVGADDLITREQFFFEGSR